MTGSIIAQLIIPIAGTLFLTMWLALVFYADRCSGRADGHPGPGHERADLAAPGCPAPAGSREDLLATSVERGNLRVIFEVER